MLKRLSTNAFIAILLACVSIDCLPSTSLFHDRLKALVDPLLDKTGLWQESWRLFAPEVDKMNVRVSAEFTYADGSGSTWNSPDWTALSVSQRFLRFREMEFIDSIRNDASMGAWPSFTDYLIEDQANTDSGQPVKVVLKRHWATVPAPVQGDRQRRVWPLPMQGEYVIYTRDDLEE